MATKKTEKTEKSGEQAKPKGTPENPEQQPQQFVIQRVYTKDSSFETPNTPQIFRQEWKPQADVHVNNQFEKIEESIYEVVLGVTVTTKISETVAFLAEVKQAGIFTITDFNEKETNHLLRSYCPTILFPYAREVISSMTAGGGFPPIYLAPINFEAIYQQELQQQENKKK